MNRAALAGLLLVAACAPPAEEPGCDLRTEAHLRIDPLAASEDPPPRDRVLDGRLLEWGAPQAPFEEQDGSRWGFGLVLDADAPLPELPDEDVHLVTRGMDPPTSEPTEPVLRVGGVTKDLRVHLMAGNIELLDPLGGWTVESPRDVETCNPWSGEAGAYRNKPVVFRHDEDGITQRLFQTESVEEGRWKLSVIAAQSNYRDHPFAPCPEVDCPWEKLSWVVQQID